jgi:hypothetical protein
VEHEKPRSATFNVLQLPAIDTNMSISGSSRGAWSANDAPDGIEKNINAKAAARP